MELLRNRSVSWRGFSDKIIQGCELAITDKAKCITCEKLVAKGTPRLWVMGAFGRPPPDEGIEKIKRFICHSCASGIIASKEREYQEDVKKGKTAMINLTKQNGIKQTYYNYLKDEEVIKRIVNDEIVQELEKGDEDYKNE